MSAEISADSVVQQTFVEVQRRLEGQGAGHGMDHVIRVLGTARLIHAEVGGNLQIIELASILHDVGDAKFHEGKELSGKFAGEILAALGVSEEAIGHVIAIVDNISFRKRQTAEPLSHEGQVVQDADRLDALGAIGIVRTIEYGAHFGQPFFDTNLPLENTGVGHFYDKLFKLKGLLNTEAAKRMAEQRELFMKQFVAQFLDECGATIILPA